MTFRMPVLKTRSLQEALKIGAHAPSLVMSLSSCYEMRNIQSVVKTPFFYADIVSDVIITCCSACTYVCVFVCVCAAQLQQSLLAFGRSTRKLIRDVMEEQQRALDILSSQVKWSSALITKFQNVWLFFCVYSRFPFFSGLRADDQSADAQLWGTEKQLWDVFRQTGAIPR